MEGIVEGSEIVTREAAELGAEIIGEEV